MNSSKHIKSVALGRTDVSKIGMLKISGSSIVCKPKRFGEIQAVEFSRPATQPLVQLDGGMIRFIELYSTMCSTSMQEPLRVLKQSSRRLWQNHLIYTLHCILLYYNINILNTVVLLKVAILA